MKNSKRQFIKKVKANFIRFRLDRIFAPVSEYILFLGYMARLSRWISRNKKYFGYNDFYNSNVSHKDRVNLYKYLMESEDLQETRIDYIEFGVGRGNSMRWWTSNNNNPDSSFHGFDTFEGLPEEWGGYSQGTFSLEGNFPDISDKRLKFYKGLFQDTLIEALKEMDLSAQKRVIHMDGDLYSSTMFSLTMLYPYLKEGDIIIFDEFVVPLDEFRAFIDFTKSFYVEMEPLGAINNYLQVAFKISKL